MYFKMTLQNCNIKYFALGKNFFIFRKTCFIAHVFFEITNFLTKVNFAKSMHTFSLQIKILIKIGIELYFYIEFFYILIFLFIFFLYFSSACFKLFFFPLNFFSYFSSFYTSFNTFFYFLPFNSFVSYPPGRPFHKIFFKFFVSPFHIFLLFFTYF